MAASLPVTILAAPADVEFARKLQSDLGIRGVPAAVASSDSHPNPLHFAEALPHLLERAGACLVLLSPAAVSADLLAQIRTAVTALQAGPASIKLVFVSLVPAGTITLPFQLAPFPLLDLTRLPYEAALNSIQAIIRSQAITGAPAPQAPAPSAPEPAESHEVPIPDLGDITLRGWGAVPPGESDEAAAEEPEQSTSAPGMTLHEPPPPPPASPVVSPPLSPPPPAPPAAPSAAPPPYPYPKPAPNAPGAPPYYGPPSYPGPPPPPPPPQPTPGSLPPGSAPSGGFGWPVAGSGDSAPAPRRETSAPAPKSAKNAPPPARELPLEQATFTAYHPKEMPPRVWQPLLVYISLDTPAALAQVSAAATDRLAGRRDQFRSASAAEATGLRRGSKLTIVPEIPGFRSNPPEMTVAWEEDAQQHEFRLRAETARPGQSANGAVKIYMGPILRGEIPVSIFVRPSGVAAGADLPENFASVVARAYRKVFASYSHRDTAIVRTCETAAETMGDRYLRDVTLLRSGEQWDERLLDAVGEADIFQLFWSEHAAKSPAVAKEWRRALALVPVRGQFIRPVYWSREPYTLPPELAAIHFERLDLARLGWSPTRAFLYTVLGIG